MFRPNEEQLVCLQGRSTQQGTAAVDTGNSRFAVVCGREGWSTRPATGRHGRHAVALRVPGGVCVAHLQLVTVVDDPWVCDVQLAQVAVLHGGWGSTRDSTGIWLKLNVQRSQCNLHGAWGLGNTCLL